MSSAPVYDRPATADACVQTEAVSDAASTAFDGARSVVATLGARPTAEGAVFGFWTPELVEEDIPESGVFPELFIAQDRTFQRFLLSTSRSGEYTWSAVRNVPVGTNRQLGEALTPSNGASIFDGRKR